MTEKFLLKIWLKDENGVPQRDPSIYKDVIHYNVVDQKFWFMRFKGGLMEKSGENQFGSFDTPFVWIPIDRIYSMEATSQNIFSDHSDKEKFIKEVLTGVSSKKPFKR